MNEINARLKVEWNNFNIFRTPTYEKWKKQKNKCIIPAPVRSAFSIFIILSISGNIEFDFVSKPIGTVSEFDWLNFFQNSVPPA